MLPLRHARGHWPVARRRAMPVVQSFPSSVAGRRWVLRPVAGLPPRRITANCLAPCLVALACSLVPARLGYSFITWFALAQVVGVWAFCRYLTRHAEDAEIVTVQPDRVLVERQLGGRVQRVALEGPWWRVRSGEAATEAWGAIEIVSPRARVVVGRTLDAVSRDRLAEELRRAIADGARPPAPSNDEGAAR